MTRLRLVVVVLAAGALAASSVLMARQQAPTPNVPGMPTLARVLVINDPASALPVVIQPGGDVQPVTIVGTPSVLFEPDAAVWTRTQRQGWEYRSVLVKGGEDPASELNAAGVDGWEAVGVIAGTGGAAHVLLKRPR